MIPGAVMGATRRGTALLALGVQVSGSRGQGPLFIVQWQFSVWSADISDTTHARGTAFRKGYAMHMVHDSALFLESRAHGLSLFRDRWGATGLRWRLRS